MYPYHSIYRKTEDLMDELSNITKEVLAAIQKKLSYTQAVFDLWFADLKLVSLSETEARFMTSTKLRKQILAAKYGKQIREALKEVIGFDVEPVIDAPVTFENLPDDAAEDIESDPPEVTKENEKETEKNIATLLSDNPGDRRSPVEDYTFDTFIEGASNKFARAACYAVAREPTTYNPLFIYGHSGLGKTHLLYAVVNYIRKNHPKLKICYKNSEDFINEMIAALGNGTIAAFKEKYRSVDVLLIDDIQFIAGKEAMQEEFFHTFTTLYNDNKQIILTSDRPPKDIKPLEDRLRTRFEGGLLADVQPPSYELRVAIIQKKCATYGLDLSQELIDYMADRLKSNIRQIEGVLKKLSAYNSLKNTVINKEVVEEVISIIDPGNIPTSVMVDRILSVVANHYGVTVDDIESKRKTDTVASARHVAIYMVRTITNLSLKEVGKIFNRDHTTVMSSINRVEILIKTKRGYEAEINAIKKEIKG